MPVVLASVFHENNQSKTAVKLTVLVGLSASLLFIAVNLLATLYPATGRSFDQDDCQKWRDSDVSASLSKYPSVIEYLSVAVAKVMLKYYLGIGEFIGGCH